MLSDAAYEVASVLIMGGCTVNDLKASTATDAVAADDVDQWLHGALLELVDVGCIAFHFEPAYGDWPPLASTDQSPAAFTRAWRRAFRQGIAGQAASIPTMYVEATARLAAHLEAAHLVHESGSHP